MAYLAMEKAEERMLMKKFLSMLVAAAVILSSAPNVYGASDGISLSADAVTLRMGITKKISVKNRPKGAKVTWKSANKRIAAVKDGTVAGMRQGRTGNCLPGEIFQVRKLERQRLLVEDKEF